MLFALRGRIDDVFSILLANVLIVIAMADYARALHLLMQRPDPRRAAAAGVLLTIVTVAIFTYGVDRIAVRIAVASLVFGAGALLPLLCSYGFLLLCNARMQQELARSAALDYLTGAMNRGAIEDQGGRALTRARRRGTPCAAIVIDVDHFKRINDAHGHAAGDGALREIVLRLRAVLRLEDGLGRLGGEEFLVLLDESDAECAAATAERLRQAIRTMPLMLESGPHPCTISLGVALLDDADGSFSDLLRRADRALYAAKAGGRDRVELAAAPRLNRA